MRNKNGKKNSDFYKKAWASRSTHTCDECGAYLSSFSPTYISHIIARGANIYFAHDLRNFNLLCGSCHHRWEFGDRKNMLVYPKNQEIKQQLLNEYYERR
jgi:hypothetical protein